MGPTGAGKSTLLNYMVYGDNGFIISDNKKEIQIRQDINTDIKIGNGEGSTTLFPNIKTTEFGNFIDFAGDCDSDGTLSKLIISIIKQKISSNVKNVKIIFVSQQQSLSNTGQYGLAFKTSLDENSEFLNFDFDYFKENIGLVITKAGSKDDVKSDCIKLLESIKNHKKSTGNYKQIIETILQGNKLTTFSKPNDKASIVYTPPTHNQNQQFEIINFINSIPFINIPNNDFFKVSIPIEINQQMKKILEIILIKVWDTINKLLVSVTSTIVIYSIETIPFFKFIKQLVYGHETSLLNFLNILNFNNWFKINEDDSDDSVISFLKNLNEKINYFYQLIKGSGGNGSTDPSSLVYKCDWVLKSNIKIIFENISNQIQLQVIDQIAGGNYFEKFISNVYENEPKSRQVEKTREVKYMESVKSDVPVIKYRTERRFKRRVGIKIPYNEDVPYEEYEIVQVEKTRLESYWETEHYSESVQKHRMVEIGQTINKKLKEDQYNNDKKNNEDQIYKSRSSITQFLSSFINEESHSIKFDTIINKDIIEQRFEDLKKHWLQAEHSIYKSNNPNNSLEEYDIKLIV